MNKLGLEAAHLSVVSAKVNLIMRPNSYRPISSGRAHRSWLAWLGLVLCIVGNPLIARAQTTEAGNFTLTGSGSSGYPKVGFCPSVLTVTGSATATITGTPSMAVTISANYVYPPPNKLNCAGYTANYTETIPLTQSGNTFTGVVQDHYGPCSDICIGGILTLSATLQLQAHGTTLVGTLTYENDALLSDPKLGPGTNDATASGPITLTGPLQAGTLVVGQAGASYPPSKAVSPLVTGGVPPFDFSTVTAALQTLGLTVDSNTGYVTGSLVTQIPDTYTINGLVKDSSGSTVQLNSSLKVFCGPPPTGDDRDTIIQQYIVGSSPYPNGVQFTLSPVPLAANVVPPTAANAPNCNQFASDQNSTFTDYFPTYFDINSKNPTYSYAFTVVDTVVTDSTGLDAWINQIHAAGDSSPRTISSSYRNPSRNFNVSTSSVSQHMLGDAIDLQLNGPLDIPSWQAEWDRVTHAARLAGADKIEGTPGNFGGPCVVGKLHCVHADWRLHRGTGYVNP